MFKSKFNRRVFVFVFVAGLICGNSFHRIIASGDDSPSPPKFGQEVKNNLPSEITTQTGIELVLIPAGEFDTSYTLGRETKSRRVIITKPFYLGKYPITQRQWEGIMGNNPSRFKGNPDNPVENVTWGAVQAFIQRINARESTNRYRLPTDAEWELAARAGTRTRYFWGDEIAYMGFYVWHRGNSGAKTHPVGMMRPSPWGLYDMLGHVHELVQDRIDGKYSIFSGIIDRYNDAPALIDPIGTMSTDSILDSLAYNSDVQNTLRGGSWNSGSAEISIDKGTPGLLFVLDKETGSVGFRLAASVD